MSEKPPTSKPEEIPQTAEEKEREKWERYELWMANNPVVEIPLDSSETDAEKVALEECEAMLDSFEQTYDLEALRAITQFDSREERCSSVRQPALDALSLMFRRMKVLGGAFDSETREALGLRYEKLSNAVGNITEDKDGNIFDVVVHDRRTPYPGDNLS
ncbi:MAG: hypothetical protein WC887_02685 [Candidatus Paceibacterota bacterium]|jgi:hypothetical protein